MKLLNCVECHDVKRLQSEWRRCACRRSAGRYMEDGRHAQVSGPARLLGMDNGEYADLAGGSRPSVFVIGDDSPRLHRV